MSAAGAVGLTAEGRTFPAVVTVGGVTSAAEGLRPELLPSENPIAKNTAHSATSPKKRASILPVPKVISVSSDVAFVIAIATSLRLALSRSALRLYRH